jgi:hypothetical protein
MASRTYELFCASEFIKVVNIYALSRFGRGYNLASQFLAEDEQSER